LPPGFEERVKASADRMESGTLGVDVALQDLLQGLSSLSATEMAVSTIGNVCLAGQLLPLFKEQLVPFCDALVDGLKCRLKAHDWRLCGRAAGALCNLVRLGDSFAAAVQERCVEPLVTALREETSGEGASSFLQKLQTQGGIAAGLGATTATGRILGVLVNLMVVRPAAAKTMLEHGALAVVARLIEPEAESGEKAALEAADATPAEISARALLLVSRFLAASPDVLGVEMEAELLQQLHKLLDRHGDFTSVRSAVAAETSGEEMDSLELAIRLLTTILVKTPGALERMIVASAPVRIQELPDDADLSTALAPAQSDWGVVELVCLLLKLIRALQPRDYLGVDAEGSCLSRMRGNIALIITKIAEAQAEDNEAPALRKLDLSPLVAILIDTLRKERGKVQHNVGVCVTRLAQNQRYRQVVRDLNGIETLHQVQLPKVEAQKEKAMKLHRIRGPQFSGLD